MDLVTHTLLPDVHAHLPVFCEDVDSRGVVGAVGHVESLHLGQQVEEEAPYSLLALWKPTHTHTHTMCSSPQHYQSLPVGVSVTCINSMLMYYYIYEE